MIFVNFIDDMWNYTKYRLNLCESNTFFETIQKSGEICLKFTNWIACYITSQSSFQRFISFQLRHPNSTLPCVLKCWRWAHWENAIKSSQLRTFDCKSFSQPESDIMTGKVVVKPFWTKLLIVFQKQPLSLYWYLHLSGNVQCMTLLGQDKWPEFLKCRFKTIEVADPQELFFFIRIMWICK